MSDYPHSSDLPWGSWMRTAKSQRGRISIVDEHGRQWPSIRDAFWSGRLRMSSIRPSVRDEQLELMLAGLASMHRGIVTVHERDHAIFFDEPRLTRLWHYWMHNERLIGPAPESDPLAATPTDEGVAVLRMLVATRPIELNAVPVGPAAAAFFGEPDTNEECDRKRFEAAEGNAHMFPFAIVREDVFETPSISMLHRDPKDAIPLARTVWHLPMPNARMRDAAFSWMLDRSDLWTRWGERVLRYGALAFTQHLLVLIVAGNSHWRAGSDDKRPEEPLALSYVRGESGDPPA